MVSAPQIKNELISELWLPVAIKGGELLRARLRKNKKFKMLTLTNHDNFNEVKEFTKNKLTMKDLITAWHRGTTVVYRLESEGLKVCRNRYERVVTNPVRDVEDIFPLDILNLDFSSQTPENEEGRVEDEIISIDNTLRLQVSKQAPWMILLYTTVLNSETLSPQRIRSGTDAIRRAGWDGLAVGDYTTTIADNAIKASCLEDMLKQLSAKYGYALLHGPVKLIKNLSGSEQIVSIAMILKMG